MLDCLIASSDRKSHLHNLDLFSDLQKRGIIVGIHETESFTNVTLVLHLRSQVDKNITNSVYLSDPTI